MHNSDQQFRLLFEGSAEPMLVLDGESLMFIECNDAAVRLLGAISRSALVNKSPVDISPKHQPDGQLSSDKAAEILRRVSIERTARFEWVHCRSDGEAFFVEVVLTSMEINRLRRVFVTWRDIGERVAMEKALRASEEKFRLLFQHSAEPMLILDADSLLFVECNQAAAEMMGYSAVEALINKSPADISPECQPDGQLSRDKALEILRRVAVENTARFDWVCRRLDGTDFFVEVVLTNLEIDRLKRVFVTWRDISDRKRAEMAIRELNANLEARVEQRTAELRQTQVELEKALSQEKDLAMLKTNFVSMVSHEFRTPLGIISVSSEVLQRYFDRLTPAQRTEHLDAIIGSVRRMSRMMEDVLLLSRVDSGRVDFMPVPINLESFCNQLIDEVLSVTDHKCPIQFRIEETAKGRAQADESLLRHILTNLLFNAVKYSLPGQPVFLRLQRTAGKAVFEVADDGMGIPLADQEHLFHAFHRAKNVEHIQGTGLGLVIVKRCCDLHQGTVGVQSQEGKGTTFTVQLPLFDLLHV